jgi:integrase
MTIHNGIISIDMNTECVVPIVLRMRVKVRLHMQNSNLHAKPDINQKIRVRTYGDDLYATLHELVSGEIHQMESAIDLEGSGRRHRFSLKRFKSIMEFYPDDFDDPNQYAKWLENQFYPLMLQLRVNRGLALATLRENLGHLSGWMEDYAVDRIIIRRFRKYVNLKTGKLWHQLEKDGAKPVDDKPRLTEADVMKLLKTTENLLKNPELLVSCNMKSRKKKGEAKARNRIANRNIALNLHAALRMGLLTTKRPNEIAAIRRDDINSERVVVHLSKVYRRGEEVNYEMWPEYWLSFEALLKSHERDTLFSLGQSSLTSWFKSLMVHCGLEHHWFNLHRLRSFSGDVLVMAGANPLEMKAHGGWKNTDSVDAYISKIGRNANLKRASEKKYTYLQTKGLVKAKPITEAELYIDLLFDLNASAHKDDGMWMTLVDIDDETVEEFLQRTGSSQMFGLDDSGQENDVNSDVSALLSMKKVDVTRFELVASTMPR